jgi:hypothetical protein
MSVHGGTTLQSAVAKGESTDTHRFSTGFSTAYWKHTTILLFWQEDAGIIG